MVMINLARAEDAPGEPIMSASDELDVFMSPLLNQQGLQAVSIGTETLTATGTY